MCRQCIVSIVYLLTKTTHLPKNTGWFNIMLLLISHPISQTPTLVHYSGYSARELLPMVERLNGLVREAQHQAACELAGQKATTCAVRRKYSQK